MTFIYEKNFKELLLDKIYPNYDWITNRTVPNAKLGNCRPDFRCEELKIIIEFNGDRCDTYPGHYSSTKRIITDLNKKERFEEMEYKVIEYPYFVQPSTDVIKLLFGLDYHYNQIFPQGFIDEKAKLPADFCELGVNRFLKELEYFSVIKKEITNSLRKKINELGDYRLVVTGPVKEYLKL